MSSLSVDLDIPLKLPNPKFLPLFQDNIPPRILFYGAEVEGTHDPMTRGVLDPLGNLVPAENIIDYGHFRTRYYVFYGGRGGAKSHQFAVAAVMRMLKEKIKVLCCREIQSTMADSVLSLMEAKINALGVADHFKVLSNSIVCTLTGAEAAFRGLRHNINELKSFEDAKICWVEEAADVSEESWDKLDPTIRSPGAEIWVGFNTELETDPTYVRFVTDRDDDMTVIMVHWYENSMLDVMMRKQALKMQKANPEKYEYVWGGKPKRTHQGGVFVPEMIPLIDAAPEGVVWVRGWDLAGTAIDPKHPERDPDWTRGMALGRQPNGRYLIGIPVGVRAAPDGVEKLMLTTMKNDGWSVEQSIPQDPGQAGKAQVAYMVKQFAGHRLHFSLETGDKVTRAGPFASQVNAGNVDMLRGAWNQAVKDEMTAFPPPEGKGHDDQIDGLSRAFNRLLKPRKMQRTKVRGL